MKFLEAGFTYKIFGLSLIKNSLGETASTFTITEAGTEISMDVISSQDSVNNVFDVNIDVVFEASTQLDLADSIFIYQDDFPIEGRIVDIGKSRIEDDVTYIKYKAVFATSTNLDIGETVFWLKESIVTVDSECEDGLYYGDSGELLIVGSGFNIKRLIDINKVKAKKPAMKNELLNWQFYDLLNTAYLKVMADIGSYEDTFAERYQYLVLDSLVTLIEYQMISLYEAGLQRDSEKYYTQAYTRELNTFKPKYKKENGEIVEAKGLRLGF